MKPNDKLKALKADTAIDRLHYCKAMLHLHGFITDAEAAKVYKRMCKWVAKHLESIK